jgi:iron(III) transport system substrate-binding protein
MAEQRARNIVGDVLEMGGGAMAAIKGNAVLPFESPFDGEYTAGYVDPKALWTATRLSYFGTAYNTKQVAEADLPKTFDDLFLSNLITLRGEKDAEAFAKKLAGQDVVNYTGSARALVDRVGQGEYAVAMNIFAHHPLISQKKGAPLDVVMLQPVPVNISTIQLVKGTSHPHAAMLLIDFVLSNAGQTVLQKANYFPAHPDVDPDPSMRKVIPRLNGMKENVFDPTLIDEVNVKAKAMFARHFR